MAAFLTSSVSCGIGVGAGVAGFALEVDGHPVAEAVLHVPVQGVVGGVDLTADEPLRERRVGPVKGLVEVLAPGEQLPGLPGPESGTVGVGLRIIGCGDNGVGGELGRWGKSAVLVQQVFEGVALLVALHGAPGAVAVEPGVSWDMVNLIIHRSFLRGMPVTAALPVRCARRGAGPITDVPQRAVPEYKPNAWPCHRMCHLSHRSPRTAFI